MGGGKIRISYFFKNAMNFCLHRGLVMEYVYVFHGIDAPPIVLMNMNMHAMWMQFPLVRFLKPGGIICSSNACLLQDSILRAEEAVI